MPNMHQAKPKTVSHEIKISFTALPRHSDVACLGFDEMRFSKNSLFVRKSQGGRLFGPSALFFEASISPGKLRVSFGVPHGSDERARRFFATAQLMRLLLLFRDAKADVCGLAEMTLPSLEFAQNASPENAHLLVKKLSDAQTDIADCQEKNKRLSSAAEEASALLMEKEREASTLFARVKSLEAMPDPVLHDSVIEWLRMHRGEFNSVQFSKANRVSPQRAHEGLRALLESNAIIQVAGAYRENGTDKRSIFQEKKRGVGWFK